jgi:hypothetical protein
MSTHTNESNLRPPLNRNVRSEKSDWAAFPHGRAMRILSGTSEREEVFSSQLRQLKREDSDTLGHLKHGSFSASTPEQSSLLSGH